MKRIQSSLQQAWRRLQSREQILAALALVLFGGAAIWWLAMSPAVKTLQNFATTNRAQESQLETMQQLQQNVKEYQENAASTQPEQDFRTIRSASQRLLGESAQINIVGTRVTVRLSKVSPKSFFTWLLEVRETAKTDVVQMDISDAAQDGAAMPIWSGTVQLELPMKSP